MDKKNDSRLIFQTPSEDTSRIPFVLMLLVGITLLFCGGFTSEWGVLSVALVLTIIPIFIICRYTYELQPDRIRFRLGGLSVRTLMLSKIDRLVPINPFHDPHHPNRYHIAYSGGRKIYLYVKSQQLFIESLLARSPHLKKYGYEWRREIVENDFPVLGE